MIFGFFLLKNIENKMSSVYGREIEERDDKNGRVSFFIIILFYFFIFIIFFLFKTFITIITKNYLKRN